MPTGPPSRIPAVRALAIACLLLLALALAGCGRERPSDEPLAGDTTAEGDDPLGAFEEEKLGGRLSADGSSTVAPLMSLAAERFRKGRLLSRRHFVKARR